MSAITRRRFVAMTTALAGSAGGACAVLWDRARGVAGRYEVSGRAFGTAVRITVVQQDDNSAKQAARAAMAELRRVESLLSLYQSDSAVVQLNQQGFLDHPPPELVEVLDAAAAMSRRSHGAFDITVQPLWELHARTGREQRAATPEELSTARRRVDWRSVRVSHDRVEFAQSHTQITLNGIAQGYVTDRVQRILRDHDVQHALLDTGEIGTLGGKQAGEPWQVGIQHPRDREAYIALARLNGRCLATSGDYATPLSDDRSRHHVFDPRTGDSPRELASVSVVAPSAMEADALSTAAMVSGAEQGQRLVSETEGAAALFVTKAGRVLATSGFPLA